MVRQLTEGLSLEQRAHVLAETLPWLQHYRDRAVVVKYGDNAVTNPKLEKALAQDMAFLRTVGMKSVVIHGGGPQISSMLKRLGLEGESRGGSRVTTPEIIEIAYMVPFGQVGHELVDLINAYGPYAMGASGKGGGLLTGTRRTVNVDGKGTNVRLVDNTAEVYSEALLDLIGAGHIPVVSTTAPSADGKEAYNINADTIADALVSAINANHLVTLTNVKGFYTDWPSRGSLVSKISTLHLREALPTLDSGMIPKMGSCLDAVDQGVPTAHAVDDCQPHSVLLELTTSGGIGTMVEPG